LTLNLQSSCLKALWVLRLQTWATTSRFLSYNFKINTKIIEWIVRDFMGNLIEFLPVFL
jgi:hypothetical protein